MVTHSDVIKVANKEGERKHVLYEHEPRGTTGALLIGNNADVRENKIPEKHKDSIMWPVFQYNMIILIVHIQQRHTDNKTIADGIEIGTSIVTGGDINTPLSVISLNI